MGWASGSELAEDLWNTIERYIPTQQKKRVATKIIDLFEMQDCDTIDEAEKLCKAAGRKPEWEDEE